jgi:hypothetical protein
MEGKYETQHIHSDWLLPWFVEVIITIKVPVVYMAQDVMILMGALSMHYKGHWKGGGGGPENQDFFGHIRMRILLAPILNFVVFRYKLCLNIEVLKEKKFDWAINGGDTIVLLTATKWN